MALRRNNLNAISRHLAVEQQDRGVQFSVITPATVSYKPTSPKALVIFGVALAAGAAVGALCVFLAEVMDRSFRTSGQVRRALGLPIIEGISEIVTPALRRQRLITQMVITPVIGMLLAVALLLAGAATYLRLERPDIYRSARNRSAQIVEQAGKQLAQGRVSAGMDAMEGS